MKSCMVCKGQTLFELSICILLVIMTVIVIHSYKRQQAQGFYLSCAPSFGQTIYLTTVCILRGCTSKVGLHSDHLLGSLPCCKELSVGQCFYSTRPLAALLEKQRLVQPLPCEQQNRKECATPFHYVFLFGEVQCASCSLPSTLVP